MNHTRAAWRKAKKMPFAGLSIDTLRQFLYFFVMIQRLLTPSLTKQAFSLVELSIVLVILGLLVGGILSGQALIRAAELRSVSTEYSRWVAATQTFRDKYFALPGDFRDATRFWQLQTSSNCLTNSVASVASPGACDGNGNGRIDGSFGAGGAAESFQFWRHLAHAGLIEGSYTGLVGPGSLLDGVAGTNMPRSRANNIAGWFPFYNDMGVTNHPNWSNGNYGNSLWLAGNWPSGGTSPYYYIITPEEAWNIDTKLDDGKPQQGKVWAIHWDTCTTASSAAATNGDYDLSNPRIECALVFKNQF